MSKKENLKSHISYSSALSRLQTILDNLRNEKVNVDQLSEQLQEAYQLVTICQDKISKVETEIKRVDKKFESTE